ncbi:MAG: MFS transporter [Merdibacter sp.]|nr:MFS transporter [Merdibacter sp.]
MSKRQRHLYYICNFLVFAALAMVNTVMIPYMKAVGYSLMQQSVILAANALIAIIGQFLFGYLCDRHHSMKRFFLIAYISFVAGTCLMLIREDQLFWYHLFSIALSSGLVKVVSGLNETWMLLADADHYGRLRAAGALGLTAGSPIAGYIAQMMSFRSLMWAFLALSALILVLLGRCKDVKKEKSSNLKDDLKDLLSNRRYLLLVLIFLLIYMAGTADQYTVVDKLLQIGGSTADVGWKWSIQSFCEFPLFLAGGWLLSKVKPLTLLGFGILMYAVKFALYAFAQEPLWIVACASLQLVTMPMVLLSSKFLIKEVSAEAVAGSAQMFAMAVFVGISALLTPLICAPLVEHLGHDVTLYGIAVFCLIPLALTLIYARRYK